MMKKIAGCLRHSAKNKRIKLKVTKKKKKRKKK
jgi:hypothetical protein